LGQLSGHGQTGGRRTGNRSTSERNGWKMRAEDFENAMTPRTKMLIMNSPGNPTGSV